MFNARLKAGYPLRESVNRTVIDMSPVSHPPDSEQMTPDSSLSTHRELQESADKRSSVSTRLLARLLRQSNSSLHGWGPVTHRLGVLIERTGSGDMFRASVDRDQRAGL